ncbi:MAG: ATP-binding cassette domain-containing protein [Gammaproteobacteria bacterium]
MLLSLRDVLVRFTDEPVLDHVNLTIEDNERLCLAGRNGAGKSTLLRVLAGQIAPDEGEIVRRDNVHIALLDQDVPPDMDGAVYEIVTHGLGAIGHQLLDYERAAIAGTDTRELLRLQHALEETGAWNTHAEVAALLSRMELDAQASFATLSGGLRRRVMLARALVGKPDLLLLDEPTNHLDIAGVDWLEHIATGFQGALVFITHDRTFLDRVATRIVEVDRGRLHQFPGDFARYRQMKTEQLTQEKQSNREFDKKLAEEEDWIRRGVKARTTRNMGRVRALEDLREQADARRKYQRRVSMRTQVSDQSSRRVVELHRVNASIAGKTILKNFTHKIRRGDVIGVMGPNGSGKTTLLRLLLGEIEPESGTLKYGENLDIAYFDQTRRQLELDRSAAWNVADGAERIEFDGKSLHVLGYLKAFLFTPQRAQTQTRLLSGGERNRLLLARLLAKPSNVLVLDEPTNDLDIETLELLENLLNGYPGTIILVSHDRTFVDNVVDGLLVNDGETGFHYYVGGYRDWVRQRNAEKANIPKAPKDASGKTPNKKAPKTESGKLSYKLQRELDTLPKKIEETEKALGELQQAMSEPEFFRQDSNTIKDAQQRLAALEHDLEQLFERWQTLEDVRSHAQRA